MKKDDYNSRIKFWINFYFYFSKGLFQNSYTFTSKLVKKIIVYLLFIYWDVPSVVDGMITNDPDDLYEVLQESYFRNEYRLATPDDDPFERFVKK